jgi:hypothetical protein
MDKFQSTESTTTSNGAETATTLDISGTEASSADWPSGGVPNGPASARSARRRPSKAESERSEQVSGAACSGHAVSPSKSARSPDGRLADVKTEAKREHPLGMGKRTKKDPEQLRAGNGSSASDSRKAPRQKPAAEVLS